MTAEQLRNSILQEAISGRLVPQDPNDEPASALLARIREEKARLVKEGKLKKKDLVETPITDEEKPFEIPSSWAWVRHNELFDISGGTQPPKSEFVSTPRNGYIQLYQIRDYGKNPQPVFIPYKKTLKISQQGDILLARYGGSLGKVFIAKDGAYNVAIAKVIPLYESELIDKRYLFLYYNSSIYQTQIKKHSRSAQAGFNKEDLEEMLFPLPPIAEQKRIVAKLEELLPIVDQYGKAQKELDELNADLPARLRQSILQEAFSGSLTHADMSEWEYVILGDICNFGKCESVDVKDIPNDAWVLELEDIEKDTARILKRLTLRERKIKGTRHKFQKGQLLYSKLRTYLNKVLVAPADGYCTGEIVPITFKDGISIEYMCHFMRSPFVIQYTASCGYGIKMPRVNPKQMNGIEVPLPPLAEQQRIVAKIEELFAEIDKLK